MRYIFLVIAVLSFGIVSAQQINPIPDYVFKNQMSVGRAAVTDTAAYMSIGPRYGAVKGFMPPMVTDTASLPANKRNGLFIFSIQKNKYLYWDSVGVKWAEMAGTAGAAMTGTGTINYIPKFTTTTNLGNSVMYDSAGHVRLFANWIGQPGNDRKLLSTEVNGENNYGFVVRQNDSLVDNVQWVMSLRKGLLTSNKPRPNFGVGFDMKVPDDAGAFREVGSILSRLTDTTAANFSSKMEFGVSKGGSRVNPLILFNDSSVRVAKLAGSGDRYVVADSDGDLKIGTSPTIVDSVKMYSSSLTLESGSEIVEDTATNAGINKIVKTVNADGTTTVTINALIYVPDSLTTDNTYKKIATIPVGYRPSTRLYYGYEHYVQATAYQRSDDTHFSFQFNSIANVAFHYRIDTDGSIYGYDNGGTTLLFYINPDYYHFFNIIITYTL